MRIERRVSVYCQLMKAKQEEDERAAPKGGRVAVLDKTEMAVLDAECEDIGIVAIPSMMLVPRMLGFILLVEEKDA